MNLKRIKVINIINIFILSFIAHNVYKYFPSTLTAIFFPINESIFEHLKIIFTSTLLGGIIDYILLKNNNITYNNFKFKLFFTSFISIPIFLIIYIPIHYLLGEYLILTLILLLITYIISQIISYYILLHKEIPLLNKISIILIILTFINFFVLTITENKDDFFYDTYTKKIP